MGVCVTDLKNKTNDCEVGQLTDWLRRHWIVCGVTDEQVRAILLRKLDFSLSKSLEICRATKDTQTHLKSLHEENKEAVNKLIGQTSKTCF